MRKAIRICCFVLGTMLLLAALALILYNRAEDRKSGEAAAHLLDEMKHSLPEYSEPELTV